MILNTGREVFNEFPFEAGIWYPGGDITTNEFVHYTRVFFTQWIPAYFVDGLCVLLGRKQL
jgi:alcohol-forming fatty acyl-CoA reductase